MNASILKKSLIDEVELDSYMVHLSSAFPSHRFLGRAAGGCYTRQVFMLNKLMTSLGKNPREVRVLDWGCGRGHISYLLKKNGFHVMSCDLYADTSDSSFGQETPIIHEQKIEVQALTHAWKLPFDDASFDLVVSFGVLEHVEDDKASLNEIRRVLRNDGLLAFFFLPYRSSWTQAVARLRGDTYHDRLYSKNRVRAIARSQGFVVEHLWHGQLFPKNSVPHSCLIERLDRWLTFTTPLRYFATNLEGVLRRVGS